MVPPVFLFTLVIAGALSWVPNPQEAKNPLSLTLLLSISLALAGLYISLYDEDRVSSLDASGRTIIRTLVVFLFPALYSLSCAFEVNEAISKSIQECDKAEALSEGNFLFYFLFSIDFWHSFPQLDRLIFLTVAYLGFFLFTLLYALEKPRGLLRKDLIHSNNKSISESANTINDIEAQKLLSPSELLSMWSGNSRPLRDSPKIYKQWYYATIRCLCLGALCWVISCGIQELKAPDPLPLRVHLNRLIFFTSLNIPLCVIQLGTVDKYAKRSDRAARIYIGSALLLFPSAAIIEVLSKGLNTAFPTLLSVMLLLIYYRCETVQIRRRLCKNSSTPPYSIQSVDDFFKRKFRDGFRKQASSIEASTNFSRSLRLVPSPAPGTIRNVVYIPSTDSDSIEEVRSNFIIEPRSEFLTALQAVMRFLNRHTRLQISRTIFKNYLFLIYELETGLSLRADSTQYHDQKQGGYVKIDG